MEGVLLDQEYGELFAPVELANGSEDLLDQDRGEAERGLVEQQQARARHERAGNGEHLLLATRKRAAALMQALLEAREQREHALEILGKMRGFGGRGSPPPILLPPHAAGKSAPPPRPPHAQKRRLL